ncbi:MAG: methylmalonyl Co-A mutase-associated GTPase MeaB [Bacteroidetes bacterium]|nr:methylmalonyl Co-A mutase-associated GTPase MeaB [Bacteroidota bacterium]
MSSTKDILKKFESGELKALARVISVVENEADGYEEILSSLKIKNVPVVGITGPPGAGKSTLINAILKKLTDKGKRIGVIAIDPTSPFNYGSLLGDRLRMAEHFTNEKVFVRSLATRGSLGGLSAKTIEVADVMRAFGFDYVFIETVGVGQSEVEIAGLADTTVLVLVPGYGDEVQTLKSGIMEIGDIFVINKSDQPNAEGFAKNIEQLVHSREKSNWTPPVLKATATEEKGIEEIIKKIDEHATHSNNKKLFLLTEKAFKLIQNKRMKDIDKKKLQKEIEKEMKKKDFNFYQFIKSIT